MITKSGIRQMSLAAEFLNTPAIPMFSKPPQNFFSLQSPYRNSPFHNSLPRLDLQPQNHSGGGLFLQLEIARNACLYLRSVTLLNGSYEAAATQCSKKRRLPNPCLPSPRYSGGEGSGGEGRIRFHKPTQFLFPSTLNQRTRVTRHAKTNDGAIRDKSKATRRMRADG